MSPTGKHHTSHQIDVNAPAEVVYNLIADAAAWPQFFGPTVHLERTETGTNTEKLEFWATAQGEVKTWISRRELDPEQRRIVFRQEVSSPPVASMGGEWIVTAQGNGSLVTLNHDFDAVDDSQENVDWISQATDGNSKTELDNIKTLAEQWDRLSELAFSFEDSVLVRGPAERVYDFLYRADLWPQRLPQVPELRFKEEVPNIQWFAMVTTTKDGSQHTTESVRVCFPGERIVYKQLVPPSLMTAHTGEWSLVQTEDGVLVTSRHSVTVNEANIQSVLGAEASVQTAREFIRKAAGGNSATTLRLAKEFAEAGGAN